MNEIERTIRDLQLYVDVRWGGTNDMFNLALTALREKLEREKGCRYCQDKSYKQKGYYIDDPAAEIVGINHYCMNCGKRLEAEHETD